MEHNILNFTKFRRRKTSAHFSRAEINQLLALYAEKQLKGEWRHSTFDQRYGLVAYSVSESPIERPLFRIIKCNHASRDKGRYVLYKGKKRVAQEHELKDLLAFFETAKHQRLHS